MTWLMIIGIWFALQIPAAILWHKLIKGRIHVRQPVELNIEEELRKIERGLLRPRELPRQVRPQPMPPIQQPAPWAPPLILD